MAEDQIEGFLGQVFPSHSSCSVFPATKHSKSVYQRDKFFQLQRSKATCEGIPFLPQHDASISYHCSSSPSQHACTSVFFAGPVEVFQTTPEIKAAQQARIRSRKCLPVGKLDIAQCFSVASSLLRNAYREKKKEEYFTGCKASPKVSQVRITSSKCLPYARRFPTVGHQRCPLSHDPL